MDHGCCLSGGAWWFLVVWRKAWMAEPSRGFNPWYFCAFPPHNIWNCPFVTFSLIVNSTHSYWEGVETKLNTPVWFEKMLMVHVSSQFTSLVSAWRETCPSLSPLDVQGFVLTKSLGWQMEACSSMLTSYIMNHEFVCPVPASAAVPAKRCLGGGASGPQ